MEFSLKVFGVEGFGFDDDGVGWSMEELECWGPIVLGYLHQLGLVLLSWSFWCLGVAGVTVLVMVLLSWCCCRG